MKRFMKARHKCPVCDRKFQTAQGRDAHYQFVHLNVEKPNKKERNSEPFKKVLFSTRTDEDT